jgi:hypothetical protein
MGCKVVVRILVFASWLGLGMSNDTSRYNRIPRNPTKRPQ